MADEPPPTPLRDAIVLTPAAKASPDGTQTYTTSLPADWCIGIVPHGGFLTGLILQACTEYLHITAPNTATSHSAPISTYVNFLRKTQVGPASITATTLKSGAGYTVLNGTLSQNNRPCFLAVVTFNHYDPRPTPNPTPPHPLNELHAPTHQLRIIPRKSQCISLPVDPITDAFRGVQKKLVYLHPPPHLKTPGTIEQWVSWNPAVSSSHLTQQGFGHVDLCFLADMFPPIPESLRHVPGNAINMPEEWAGKKNLMPAWYPTLSYNVEMKQTPPKGGWKWLFVRVSSVGGVRGGRFDEFVEIFDEMGELVALSTQVALVVGAERNLGRGKKIEDVFAKL